jgi:hypothetical protein
MLRIRIRIRIRIHRIHVFGPPGSGSVSISQRYGSSYHAKIVLKNLDSYYFVTLFDFRIHTKMSWIRNTEIISETKP